VTRPSRYLLERLVVAAVAVAAVALVAYKLFARMSAGPDWDAFSFLANAADLIGRGYGYTEPARPPLISVITAIPLALGFFDERAIQVVDALLTLGTLAGFYLLLRRRFVRPLAAFGALAVLMAPPVWEWVAVGYTDLAAVGLCVWALYFAVRGTEDDSRWLLLAFPTLMAATLMRVTSLLFAFPFVLWLALRARPFRQRRELAGGVLVAVALYLPFAVRYQRIVGDALYPFVAGAKVQEAGAVREVASFVASLHRLAVPVPLAAFALIALALAAFGLAKTAVRFLRQRRVHLGRIALAAIVAGGAFLAARAGGLALQQAAVGGGIYLIWRLLGSEARETRPGVVRRVPADLALDAAVLAWFLGYLAFHETWAQRVSRYYITMAPGVIYLVLLGFRVLAVEAADAFRGRRTGTDEEPLQTERRHGRPLLDLAPALAWAPLVLLLAAGLTLDAVSDTPHEPNLALQAARKTAVWLERQPDVRTASIYSDLWPATAWYLQRDVKAMPLFTDERAVGHELRVNRATYYMSAERHVVDGYEYAFEADSGRVFVASAEDRPELPRVLYLGGGWENYLESLDAYNIHLQHAEGDYNLQGTAFLDAYGPSVLRRYDTIAAFGFLWHDRSGAERALEQWVADGGTLVIDASANLEPPASLDASVLFDTVIRRGGLPRAAQVHVAPGFAAEHALESVQASPFVTEDGKAWYGASYEPLPGSAPLKVLASAEGRPLIAQRDWGRGRVLWVGYNFAWHAYRSGNVDEARLVSAVLDEALAERGERRATRQ
jgi:hypothetical protein